MKTPPFRAPHARRAPVAAAVLSALLAACSSESPSSARPEADDNAADAPGVPTADTANAVVAVPNRVEAPTIVGYTTFAPNGASDGEALAQLQLAAATPDAAEPGTGGASVTVMPAGGDGEAAPEAESEPTPEATPEPPSEPTPDAELASGPPAGPGPEPDATPEPAAQAPAPDTGAASPAVAAARPPIVGAVRGDVEKILTDLQVSSSQLQVQQTPVDTQDGYVYTANIEHGPEGGGSPGALRTDLHTVVRQGSQGEDGQWRWTEALVEDRTAHDQWHSAPSVAADEDGYVHVAYNMHNMPWQYKRSTAPHDIGSFEFLGQEMSQAEIDRSRFENKTSFPDLGTAEIPGNQVTYPSFHKNNARDLYLTYRFAAKPKRSFPERQMSTGIARYDTAGRDWSPIGVEIDVDDADRDAVAGAPERPTAFASDQGWTSYLARLMFDGQDNLHISAFWRSGIAGELLVRPCFFSMLSDGSFTTAQGAPTTLPVTADDCGNLGLSESEQYNTVGSSTMDSTGTPHVVVSPVNGGRSIMSFDPSTGWTSSPSPNAATELFVDGRDTLWAVANGPVISKRERGSTAWETVYEEGARTYCYPQSTLNEDASVAYIHTHSCDDKERATIYALRLE